MTGATAHSHDSDLVERCLEGSDEAFATLRQKYGGLLRVCLERAGASAAEATEIIETLWTDCVAGSTRGPRFHSYRGECALEYWLKAVAMNSFIDRRRQAERRALLAQQSLAASEPIQASQADEPLRELLENALRSALRKCPDEPLVLLQLVYLGGLTQREAARMWSWTDAKVSRVLAQTLEQISRETLRSIQRTDGWLDLTWRDFLELCDGGGEVFFVGKL